MKIQRTIPPAAASIHFEDLLHGFSGFFFSENHLKKVEAELKAYFDVPHVFLVSSGKAALTLILRALKSLSPRRKVLIPAYTCFSVPSAVIKAGLDISLCDVDLATFDFNHRFLDNAICDDTLCVIPSHLFGIPADMDRINDLCRERGVYVVEDAAQAMGGFYKGNRLGTLGDVGFFSLGRGKNITCGNGGIIVTNSDRIAYAIAADYFNLDYPTNIEVLKEFSQVVLMRLFSHPYLYWLPSGLPYLKLGQTLFYKDFPVKRMSGMQAGLLWKWQSRLEQSNQVRAGIASYFTERLRLNTRRSTSISYIRLPVLADNQESRDQIYSISQERGLGLSIMYPTPINVIEEIKATFYGQSFPMSREVANRLLTIPTHHLVTEKDKETVCELFNI